MIFIVLATKKTRSGPIYIYTYIVYRHMRYIYIKLNNNKPTNLNDQLIDQ